MQNILDIKEQLLNFKNGDTFRIDAWLFDGQRFYDIKIGTKWVYLKAVYGKSPRKKITKKKAKELFSKVYWKAAATDCFYRKCRHSQELERKKRRLPRNWKREYK